MKKSLQLVDIVWFLLTLSAHQLADKFKMRFMKKRKIDLRYRKGDLVTSVFPMWKDCLGTIEEITVSQTTTRPYMVTFRGGEKQFSKGWFRQDELICYKDPNDLLKSLVDKI